MPSAARNNEIRYAFENPRIQADNMNGLNMAKEALDALDTHYPGWGWHVMVRQGVLMVRLPSVSNKYGMNTRITEFDHDATSLKRRVINAAGEFLERARMKRGAFRGERITAVEGIPRAKA